MKKIFWFALITTVLVASLVLAKPVLSQESPPMTITDLNIADCGSTAADINESGQIVGWATNCNETEFEFEHAFFRDIDGTVIAISPKASAYGINDLGQVVGGMGEAYTPYRAFLWTETDGIKMLQINESWLFSTAYEINNQGQVVGGYNTYPQWGTNGAFLWSAETGMIDLNQLTGAPLTCAYDINESGQIVGLSLNGPFIWTPGIGIHYITDNPHDYAYSINDAGQVVGYTNPEGNYIWSETDGMTYLGVYDENFIGINDLGQVSGQIPLQDAYYQSYLWTPDMGILMLPRLDNPDHPDSFAGRSNNDGQIVGVSAGHAVLWTVELPPPTPQKQIAAIDTKVDALVSIGTLDQGEGTALISKLDAATFQVNKGNNKAARNILGAFINTVEAFVNRNRLTPIQAQPLINATNAAISKLP